MALAPSPCFHPPPILRGVPQSAASHVSAHLKPVKPRLKLANAVGSQPCASRGRPPPALPSESAELLDVFDGTAPSCEPAWLA